MATFDNSTADAWPDSADLDATLDETAVTIARFPNIAEAGFFAHELMHQESVPVQLSVDESFDAGGGYWNTRYLLSVPESYAESAAAVLQQLIEQTSNDGWEADDAYSAAASNVLERAGATYASAENEGSIHWLPIVITLAAGSFVFWGARKLQEAPARRGMAPVGREHQDLWEDLSHHSRPWVQLHDNGRGVRELRIEGNAAVLSTDADGNGHFESRQRFQRPLLVK